jgi:hypothetical protein
MCPTAPISWHRAALEPPRASWLQLPPLGHAIAPGPPRAPWPQLPSPGTGQLWDRHVSHGSSSCHPGPRQLRDRHVPCGPGSSSHLLEQDISKAATFPVGRSCGLRAIKVNKYHLAARPSWSPSGHAHVSSKALCDKDSAVPYKACSRQPIKC